MLSIVLPALMTLLALCGAARAQAQPAQPAPAQPAAAQPVAPVAVPAPAQQPTVLAPPALAAPRAPAAAATVPVAGERSPATALQLSLLGTLGSAGLLFAGGQMDSVPAALLGLGGLVVAPSWGHFYAGDHGRGWGQIGLRALGLGVSFVGAITLIADCGFEGSCPDVPPGLVIFYGGLVFAAGSAIYSVYDAPRATRRQNARLRTRQLMLTPAPMAGPDQSSGFGLQLGGRF